MYIAPKLWLGSVDSGDHLLVAMDQYREMELSGKFAARAGMSTSREELGLPPLYHNQQGVGVVTIAGPLIAGNAGFMAYFGVTGYGDIRQALTEAASDMDAKSIMLHVSSGGGQVDGCEDLAAFMRMVGKIKPMTTYADGAMCSAAYWAGSHGLHISTNQTSTVGSLGVVMVHMDRSEQFKQEGIKPTVIRAGKYKQLSNSVEPLSAEAKAELEEMAQTIYKVFITAVSQNRKVPYGVADQQMGQGREFLGRAAMSAGLVDALFTYEQALAYAKKA